MSCFYHIYCIHKLLVFLQSTQFFLKIKKTYPRTNGYVVTMFGDISLFMLILYHCFLWWHNATAVYVHILNVKLPVILWDVSQSTSSYALYHRNLTAKCKPFFLGKSFHRLFFIDFWDIYFLWCFSIAQAQGIGKKIGFSDLLVSFLVVYFVQ